MEQNSTRCNTVQQLSRVNGYMTSNEEMPAKAVNGMTAYASDTWRLKIHIHRYVFSIATSPGVASIDVFLLCWLQTETPNLGKLGVTHMDKLTFETRILGLSNDTKIVLISLKVWSQITSMADRQTEML